MKIIYVSLIGLFLLTFVGCVGSDSLSYEEKVYLILCRAKGIEQTSPSFSLCDQDAEQEYLENPALETSLNRLDVFRPDLVNSSFDGTQQSALLSDLKEMDIGHPRYLSTHLMLQLSMDRWIKTAQDTQQSLEDEEQILHNKFPGHFGRFNSVRSPKHPLGYYSCRSVLDPSDDFREMVEDIKGVSTNFFCGLLEQEYIFLLQLAQHFVILSRTEDVDEVYLKSDNGFRNRANNSNRLLMPW